MECTSIEVIAEHLTPAIRMALSGLSAAEKGMVSEVRLYVGRAVVLVYPDRVLFLTTHGTTASPKNSAVVRVSAEDMRGIVDSLCHYSIHSCRRELTQGCFALGGGVRAGVSGSYSTEGVITEVTGLNFRVSRNVRGCAEELLPLAQGGLLICGAVNSGKTTILRDLCRLVGDRRKVTLIDERNEIAGTTDGKLLNDVGALTDVLAGCPRSYGITAAVRTLSPDLIFCDEIATAEDCDAILRSVGCGVRFCATIHGEDFDGLMMREVAAELVRSGVFANIAFLCGASAPGRIREIRRVSHA